MLWGMCEHKLQAKSFNECPSQGVAECVAKLYHHKLWSTFHSCTGILMLAPCSKFKAYLRCCADRPLLTSPQCIGKELKPCQSNDLSNQKLEKTMF